MQQKDSPPPALLQNDIVNIDLIVSLTKSVNFAITVVDERKLITWYAMNCRNFYTKNLTVIQSVVYIIFILSSIKYFVFNCSH